MAEGYEPRPLESYRYKNGSNVKTFEIPCPYSGFGAMIILTHYDIWGVRYENGNATFSRITSMASAPEYVMTSVTVANNTLTVTFADIVWGGIVALW